MPGKGEKSLSGIYDPGRVLPLKGFSVSLSTTSCQAWRVYIPLIFCSQIFCDLHLYLSLNSYRS